MKVASREQIEKIGEFDSGALSIDDHLLGQNGYEPRTDEERALDRKINLKLDLCVVLILSVGFVLCGSKSEIASSFALSASVHIICISCSDRDLCFS